MLRSASILRLGKLQEVVEGLAVVFGNEAEVQVAEVVINRAPAGKPPHHLDIVVSDVFLVDLFDRILMLADNDGRTVDVKQQVTVFLHRQMLKGKFLDGQVDGRVGDALVIDKQHGLTPPFKGLYSISLVFAKRKTSFAGIFLDTYAKRACNLPKNIARMRLKPAFAKFKAAYESIVNQSIARNKKEFALTPQKH